MSAEDKIKIEDITNESEEDTDDDMPELESAEAGNHDSSDANKNGKQNRAEKKSRKMMSKLGMKQFPGIKRVTIKKSKNVLFVISAPDVYKSQGSDSYIIFGEAKIEDLSAQAAQAATQDAFKPAASKSTTAPAADEGPVDETGLKAKDIELVLNQAPNVSRGRAVKALRESNGDVITAIMVSNIYLIYYLFFRILLVKIKSLCYKFIIGINLLFI